MSQLDHKVNFESVATLEMILGNSPGDYDQLLFQLPALIEEVDELRAVISKSDAAKSAIKRELIDVLVLCYAITATMDFDIDNLPIDQPSKEDLTEAKIKTTVRIMQQAVRNPYFADANRGNFEIHTLVNKLLAIASYYDIDLQTSVNEYMRVIKTWYDHSEKDAIESWTWWEDQGATCVIRAVSGLATGEAYIVLASDNCIVNSRHVYNGKWLKSIKREKPVFTDS